MFSVLCRKTPSPPANHQPSKQRAQSACFGVLSQRGDETLRFALHAYNNDEDVERILEAWDFYLQELIRETNTMASKSNLAELTEVVVSMKSTIEQMREQAANIE